MGSMHPSQHLRILIASCGNEMSDIMTDHDYQYHETCGMEQRCEGEG